MNAFTGTTRLLRLALRRDRFVLAAWVLVLSGLLTMFTAMFADSLPTQADVLRETRFMAGNAGFRMLSLSSGRERRRLRDEPDVRHASPSWPPS